MEYKATMSGINNRKLTRIKGLIGEVEVAVVTNNSNHPIHEKYIQDRINDIKRLVDEMVDIIPEYPKE
jgi:hypothetical protein